MSDNDEYKVETRFNQLYQCIESNWSSLSNLINIDIKQTRADKRQSSRNGQSQSFRL